MKRWISIVLAAALIAGTWICDLPAGSGGRETGAAQGADSGGGTDSSRSAYAADYEPVFPVHEPLGKGVGAMPGRVVWAYDPRSVEWDGTGYWWRESNFDETVIQNMVDNAIAALAGADSAAEGWQTLFRSHNQGRDKTGGYRAGEKIAIKVNMNGSGTFGGSEESTMDYTNPMLVRTLLLSLVREAGVAPGDITVYDASRYIPEYMIRLCGTGALEGVQFRYFDPASDNNAEADLSVPVVWSQSVSGETNYLPKCVTSAEYLINMADLKGHSYGLTLCGKNHFGTIMNSSRLRPPEAAGIHRYLTQNRMDAYTVLVDLLANDQLGGKTVLYGLDALICAPSEGASVSGDNSRWQQAPFDNDYTASVFFSQDPVALDSVGADFLMNEPTVTSRNGALRGNPNVENYLHEAGAVSAPPSGAQYFDGAGARVTNLGVHEHWNNTRDKQYSRNLGKSEGIELVQVRAESGSGSESSPGEMPDGAEENDGFGDVPPDAWYAEAVEYCHSHGLMSGTGNSEFSPEVPATRAMLVSILHRGAGSPGPARSADFTDVPVGAWYRVPLLWAVENGVAGGYGDGRFGPDDPVSREQLAVMLWQLAGRPEASGQTAGAGGQAAFADQSEISDYALQAVAWARESGTISGKEGDRFDPQGTATRAETAVMLYHYLNR